jgi:eukaryotic-like serine/threonine-protein kinase
MPEWLASRLPEGWTGWHLAAATVGLAVTSALVSVVVIGFALARLPADYFVNPEARRPIDRHPVLKVLFILLRNVLGYVLIGLGLILSLPGVPGQGLLTILMGVMLIDFPGKHRAERWLLTRRGMLTAVNRLRAKLGRPPLITEVGDENMPRGGRGTDASATLEYATELRHPVDEFSPFSQHALPACSILYRRGFLSPRIILMARLETARDVLDLLRRVGLVGEARLTQAAAQLSPELPLAAVLDRLVVAGVLTAYQAAEVAAGRGPALSVGGYRLLDQIGRGGMSQVYLAEHALLGKRVAVKILTTSVRFDPEARRRFVREARAAAAVSHPNIVHVYDIDIEHEPSYLVMEYVDGVNLQAAVSRQGTFSAGEAAAVGAEVARGLAAAADAGLVHRDIKPANLLVDRRGGVKILDLGIVHLAGDETHPPGGGEVILGTLDYLAPEQAVDSAGVDGRADVYALGATLYFLLAGHPPFPGPDVRHKLAAKQFSDPPPIHRLRPDVEPGLSQVIESLMARDRLARCPSAAEAAAALAAFAAAGPDYPSRLFRSSRPSTFCESTRLRHDRDSGLLPPTELIRKPPPILPDPPTDSGLPTAQ